MHDFYPGLHSYRLTDTISWQFYVHWGQTSTPPTVVQSRLYEGPLGFISAVYSYPNGIGLVDHYFWEIWNAGGERAVLEDVERYDTEAEMEARIIQALEIPF
jgi:hypothetical protein